MRRPNTDTLLDRALTRDVLRRVGAVQLVFTVADVRREMERTDRNQLVHPKRLSNYVNAQVGRLIAEVEPSGLEGQRGPRRFVLLDRQRQLELVSVAPAMEDKDRTLIALWLAFEVNEGPVATKDVTAVLAGVPALRPTGPEYPTATRLGNLAAATPSRASRSWIEGERWVRWTPRGTLPELPEMDLWRTQARAALAADATRSTGRATRSGVVVDLIALAVQRARRSWPTGRPVTMKEIRAAAATLEGAGLQEAILAKDQTLPAAVSEAARQRVGGSSRKQIIVTRVTEPIAGSTFYDVPGLPGHETRARYVDWLTLRRAGSDAELDRMAEEIGHGTRLLSTPQETLAAIGAARVRLALQELEGLLAQAQSLIQIAADLPAQTSAALRDRHDVIRGRLDQLRRFGPAGRLEERISALVEPKRAIEAQRPLCGHEEVQALLPSPMLAGKDAGQFLRDIVGLRRYSNPDYAGPGDADPRRRLRRMVDRVDLLRYLCTRFSSPMTPLVEACGQLLGRNLRSVELAKSLADDLSPAHAGRGLICLALLGAVEEVVERAYPTMERWTDERELVQVALWALLLVREIDGERLQDALGGRTSALIRPMAERAMMAANQRRWLLPA